MWKNASKMTVIYPFFTTFLSQNTIFFSIDIFVRIQMALLPCFAINLVAFFWFLQNFVWKS